MLYYMSSETKKSETGHRDTKQGIETSAGRARSKNMPFYETRELGLSLDNTPSFNDPVTKLPSITSLFSDFKPIFSDPAGVTIIYVHLDSNELVEDKFGGETLDVYDQLVANFLSGIAKTIRRESGTCVVAKAFADDFILIKPYRGEDSDLSSRITDGLARHISAVDDDLSGIHQAYIGQDSVTHYDKFHPEHLLYRGIQKAHKQATNVERQELDIKVRAIDRCLRDDEAFQMVYQPIVNCRTGRVFAYESLVRCQDDLLRNPLVLLSTAEKSGRLRQLTRVLRKQSVANFNDVGNHILLFINVHPEDFEDPQLLAIEPHIAEFADRIVFEITERAAISDFERFRNNLQILRDAKIRIAIDDLGSGYAALNAAVELRPEFLKLDMNLIRGIDANNIRQNLIKKIVDFANESGSRIIAEGVETAEEYQTVVQLGCHFVQGYYCAKPAPRFRTTEQIIIPAEFSKVDASGEINT